MPFSFSIRQMFIGVAVLAVVCALLGGWANGSPVAYGLTISILGWILAALVFSAIYWLSLPTGKLIRSIGNFKNRKNQAQRTTNMPRGSDPAEQLSE